MPAPADDGVSIGLLGDVMLGRGVGEHLVRRSPEALWSTQLRGLLGSLDLVACNLECCVSTRGRPTSAIPGKPFFFRAPPVAIEALRAAGVRAAGLANNHALDFGEDALADTAAALGQEGIAGFGAGCGPAAARRAAVVASGDSRVALVGVTDHPAQYAAPADRWGVAWADLRAGVPDWLAAQLAGARERGALTIAFPHWGPNMTTAPADWQVRAAAQLQAAGADLVAGHSAHLPHGVGWTAAGPIVYDLGDALDDYRVDPRLRNDLGVLAVWRPGAGERELELVGLRLEHARTGMAAGADAEWIAGRLARACRGLGTRVERTAEATLRVRPR